MGQSQHTNEGGVPARGRRLGWRTCLRKGCGRRFPAGRHNQRYCREPECLAELRRWQAAKRQHKHRAGAEGRQQHAEAERRRRKRKASAAAVPQEGQRPATAAAPARGHAAHEHPQVFCARPGCYQAVRESPGAPASYCGDDCRAAVNRVRDRERKWLLRNRPAGRFKRLLEYQAARGRRGGGGPFRHGSAATCPAVPLGPLPSAVVHSRCSGGAQLNCGDSRKVNRHDSEASPGSRPRAPPAGGRLVVD